MTGLQTTRGSSLIDRLNALDRRLANLERAPWLDAIGLIAGGTFTSTPGTVTAIAIPHGLVDGSTGAGAIPTMFMVEPANVASRGAPAYHLTADATNVNIVFASALTIATAYSWVWLAKA